jgi:hypothetical protein
MCGDRRARRLAGAGSCATQPCRTDTPLRRDWTGRRSRCESRGGATTLLASTRATISDISSRAGRSTARASRRRLVELAHVLTRADLVEREAKLAGSRGSHGHPGAPWPWWTRPPSRGQLLPQRAGQPRLVVVLSATKRRTGAGSAAIDQAPAAAGRASDQEESAAKHGWLERRAAGGPPVFQPAWRAGGCPRIGWVRRGGVSQANTCPHDGQTLRPAVSRRAGVQRCGPPGSSIVDR